MRIALAASLVLVSGIASAQENRDRHGDPLPPGASARLGTVRYRTRLRFESLAWAPSGDLIACDAEPVLTVFDAQGRVKRAHAIATDRTLARATADRTWGNVALSPDGTAALYFGHDRIVSVIDVATGATKRLDEHAGAVLAAAFAPDGRSIASAGADRSVRLWDLDAGKTRALEGHQGSVLAVAWRPDGTLLASSASDDTIRLWDAKTGQARTLERPAAAALAWSPDGSLLACGGKDGVVEVIAVGGGPLARGTVRLDLHGPGEGLQGLGGVLALAFSPDGKTLAVGGDFAFETVDPAAGKLLSRDPVQQVHAVSWEPSGKRIAAATRECVVGLFTSDGKRDPALEGPADAVTALSFSPDGRKLLAGNLTGPLVAWDVATERLERTFTFAPNALAVAFLKDGKRFLATADRGELVLADLEADAPRARFRGHDAFVERLGVSPDEKALLTIAIDGVRLWDVATRDHVVVAHGKQGRPDAIAFSPADPDVFATARSIAREDLRSDPVVQLWARGPAPAVTRTLDGDEHRVHGLAFLPDGQRLVVAGLKPRLVDLATGGTVVTYDFESPHHLALSPDGLRVAFARQEHVEVAVFDVSSGARIATLKGHLGDVRALAFAPSGKLLATGSQDSTILLWPIE